MRLPESLSNLFANYVFSSLDSEQHASLVIKTVLAHGTWEQIMWLFDFYGRDRVAQIFRDDYFGMKTLPKPTRRLWELVFVDESHWDRTSGLDEWRVTRVAPRLDVDD
jgi:hypothetical protein